MLTHQLPYHGNLACVGRGAVHTCLLTARMPFIVLRRIMVCSIDYCLSKALHTVSMAMCLLLITTSNESV